MTGPVDGEILTTHNFTRDAFGVGVTQTPDNKIDLPSTYDFSTERYLLVVNGSRVDPNDASFVTYLTDAPSRFDLTPGAGDTVELRVRERPRYVPGFEILFGIAWYMDTAMPSGGVAKVGLRELSNGNQFKVEYSTSSVEVVIEKGGTETLRQAITDGYMRDRDTTLAEKLQQPQVDRGKLNMYGVGAYKPGISYLSPLDTDVSLSKSEAAIDQKNENMLAEFLRANDETVTDDVGVGNLSSVNTDEFNLHLSVELDLSGAASGATLSALSKQFAVLGDVDPTARPKPFTFFDLGGSISDGWNDGVMALRTRDDRKNINTNMDLLGITPTTDMELVAMAFNPSDITFTDSNFAPVQEQASYGGQNTAFEANAVDAPFSYPTRTYTDPKGDSVTVPDQGRVLNRATETAGSSAGGGTAPPGEFVETKREIYNDDIILLIPRGAPGTSGGTLTYTNIVTKQDW